MEIRIGSPATGLNFYKRPKLIAKLLRALRRGNVAFLGPRRTGKTSCLEEIKANPGKFIPILLNLEKHDTVEAWLADMLNELRAALEKPQPQLQWAGEKLMGFLDRIKTIPIPMTGESVEIKEEQKKQPWRKTADSFLKLLAESDVPVLFMLDEFPTFLKLVAKKSSVAEVESVLNWFRSARTDLKDRQARFLVTGSIGLKGVVKQMGLAPSVNEFDTVEIPPLLDNEALGLLETLAKDQNLWLDLKGKKKILQMLGANWPILLQLFIAEIEDGEFAKSPTAAQLETIYREKLVHGGRNQYCDGMHGRIKDIFTRSEAVLARDILRDTCRATDGLRREDFEALHEKLVPEPSHRAMLADELDHVLDTLKHDGYLLQQTEGEQRTAFASNILRDFWLRKTA